MCTISYSALFFFSPFLIAAKVLQLISLTPSPQKVPPNLPKVLLSSCNPILQKKIQTHTPFTFRPHVQKQQILLFAFKIMSTVLSQYVTFQTLLHDSLSDIPSPSALSKVLFKPYFLQARLPQHLSVILCFGDSFLHWFKKRVYASKERPQGLESRDLC